MLYDGVRLGVMEAVFGVYERDETMQEQTEIAHEYMERAFGGQLPLHERLPYLLRGRADEEPVGAHSTVVLQVFDASTTVMEGGLPWTPHPNRHLTRLEVVVWGCPLRPDELDDAKKVRLECGGRAVLYAVLDKEFECTVSDAEKWKHLCLLLPRALLEELMTQAQRIDYELDLAICLGLTVQLGFSEKQVLSNAEFLERGSARAGWAFDPLAQLDAVLAPVTDLEQVEPFLKHGKWCAAPQIRNWKADIGGQSLWRYLRKMA